MILFIAMAVVNLLTFGYETMRKPAHYLCFWWSDAVMKTNPFWKIQIYGMENIDYKQKYIIVCNHQSFADIVVLYQTRMQFKWVAKNSLFKIPFLGWCLSLSKHIKLERGDRESIRKVYHQASVWLDRGMSVLFFPEGTRSETQEVHKFHNGAFRLALQKKTSVLPIVIKGSGRALHKGTWKIDPCAKIQMTILPAIKVDDDYRPGDFKKLMDTVRTQIQEVLRKKI